MKFLKYPPCGEVYDVNKSLFDVRDARTTKHGFDLLFGVPVNTPLGSYRGGLPRLIATPALQAYWELNRTKRRGEIFDLPAGRTTLKRLRRRLGFNSLDDVDAFYQDRIADLKTLTAREFAERYGVDIHVVMDRRFRMLGRKARLHGWWQNEKALEILRAPITLREAGERLGIKTSQVHRLRERIRLDSAAQDDAQFSKAA
jgi:hypothetical protein